MSAFTSLVDWITANESFLSGLAAIIVLAGVVLSPIGIGIRRLFTGADPAVQKAAAGIGQVDRTGSSGDEMAGAPCSHPPITAGPQTSITLKDLTAPSPYPTEFAINDGLRIAYNKRGEGPPNILLAPGIITHLNIYENMPGVRESLAGLSRFAHVVNFDKRGQGLSDPTMAAPSLDDRSRDMLAVMDGAGLERAFLLGISEAGPTCIHFAHTYPERVQGLILLGSTARFTQSEDFPIGIPAQTLDALAKHWGKGVLRRVFFPSIPESQMSAETYRAMEHLIGPRDVMRQAIANMIDTDVRELLPLLRVPTLVIHFAGDLAVPIRLGRAMAEAIPGAEFLEINAVDHADLSQSPEAIARIEAFCAETLGASA